MSNLVKAGTFEFGYVLKSDPTSIQEYPIPENLDEYWEVLIDYNFDYRARRYDSDSKTWVLCEVRLAKIRASKRASAMKDEANPLFQQWQYDQTAESEQVWRSKVAEIDATTGSWLP